MSLFITFVILDDIFDVIFGTIDLYSKQRGSL